MKKIIFPILCISFVLSLNSLYAQNTCASVDLEIFFDYFPSQTSWDIIDATGAVVTSGGTYGNQPGNNLLSISPVCLPDGCYDLNFYDSLKNGMCPFIFNESGLSTFITPGTTIAPGTIVGILYLGGTPGLCGNYTLTDANGDVLVTGGGQFGAQETTQFCLVNGAAPRIAASGNQGLASKNINVNFEINPSVASNFITVNYSDGLIGQLRILDLSGKTLREFSLSNQIFNRIKIDITEEKTGVYFAQIITYKGEVNTKKFMKQ